MTNINTVYFQVFENSGFPINNTSYDLWYGCNQLGIEAKPYSHIQQIEKQLSEETVVTGWIRNVKAALMLLNKPVPEVPDVPKELINYYGREIWYSTIGKFRNSKSSDPVFIKPKTKQKAFNGHVSSNKVFNLIETANQPEDLEIICSEPISFLSEYRCMIHNGLIISCRHYAGDCSIFPDINIVKKAIKDFKSAPCAYSMDIGIEAFVNKTLIVEINDAFSLGSYGTPAVPYTNMIIDRWKEMTK